MKNKLNQNFSIKSLPNLYQEEATFNYFMGLEKIFLAINPYNDAASEDAPFLLLKGNKGSGKTIILQRIIHRNPQQVVGIFFRDFYEVIIQRVKDRHPDDPNATINSLFFDDEWTIELWGQVTKQLYKKHLATRLVPVDFSDYETLFSFAEKHGMLENTPWTQKVLDAIRIIDFSYETKDKKFIFKPAQPLVTTVISPNQITITDVLSRLLQKTPIIVIVDEIDEIGSWNDVTKASLVGLFLASKRLIRIINQNPFAKRQGLRIRVAIREDMLRAATNKYVGAEKLPDKGVSFSWTSDTLLEMLVRPLRALWAIEPNEITTHKLFVDFFPSSLDGYEQTIEKICSLSHNNPRALVQLVKTTLEDSINRQQKFFGASYEPICVLPRDIYNAISQFSEKRTELIVSSNEFMFPGLAEIIPTLQLNYKKIAVGEYLSYKSLSDFLVDLLKDDELLKKVNSWPDAKLKGKDEIIRRLYLLDFFRTIKDDQEISTPVPYTVASKLMISPMYKPYFENYQPPSTIAFEKQNIEDRLEKLTYAIDELKNNIQLPKLPENNPLESFYSPQAIRYSVSKLFWTMRFVQKGIIAYEDNIFISANLESDKLLTTLETGRLMLVEVFNISMRDSNIIAILMNSFDGDVISIEEFAQSVEQGTDAPVYLKHSKGIQKWVLNLRKNASNPTKYRQLTAQVDNILKTLRVEFSRQIEKIAVATILENGEIHAK